MNRSLAAVLVFLVVPLAIPSKTSARSHSSGDRGGLGIFRLHGGTAHPDPGDGSRPGWIAGGAVGFGVSRAAFLLFGYDRLHADQRGRSGEGIGAMTVQCEVGKPFHGVVSPRLNAGAGVYVRSRAEHVYTLGTYPYQYQYTRTNAPFGMNLGGGLSFRLSRNVMLDLDARYHQTTGTEDSKTLLSTFTAGLSFALSGKAPPDPDGYVQASR